MQIKSSLNLVSDAILEKAVAEEIKIQDPKKDLIEGIIYENTKRNDRNTGCGCNKKNCEKTSP